MIITRRARARAAGQPTGMPARPCRTVRYSRALSPVLLSLASLPLFHSSSVILCFPHAPDLSHSDRLFFFSFRAYVETSMPLHRCDRYGGPMSSAVTRNTGKCRGRTRCRDPRYRAIAAISEARVSAMKVISSFCQRRREDAHRSLIISVSR
jgi:hypothetical protein